MRGLRMINKQGSHIHQHSPAPTSHFSAESAHPTQARMMKHCGAMHSPVSVVGFDTPEHSSSNSSSGLLRTASGGTQRPPTSLLTSLLTSTGQLQSLCSQADEDEFDEDDACFDDEEEAFTCGRGHEHCSDLLDKERPCTRSVMAEKTTPIAVPTTLWLRDPNAVNELRRMHYERCARRVQLEQQQAMLAQQQLQAHQAALQAHARAAVPCLP